MAKYLNLDGLQTLWAKLKDTFALKKHSHTVEDIPVDSALSSTSENPVQNKVVNTALAGKSATSHAHGLSNNSFYGTCTNSTTDDGWKMLDSNIDGKTSNYAALRAIRFNASAPAWAVGSCGAGIFFGGADTKGLISLTYPSNAINVKFAGGSGSKPAWWFGLSGSSGKNYTLENMRERYSLAYHRNSTDNKQWTKIAWHQESNYPTGDSWNNSTAVLNFYQNSYGGAHLANLGRLMLQSYWGHSKVAEGGTPYSFKTSGTKNAYWQHYIPAVCYVGDYTTYNSGRLNVKIVCSDDTIEWWVANCIWDTQLQFDVLYKYNINLSGNGAGSVIMTNDEFNEYCEDKLVRDVSLGDGTIASSAVTASNASNCNYSGKADADTLVVKRTNASGGAFVKYYPNNQTTVSWRVGSNQDGGQFIFQYKDATKAFIDKNGAYNGDVKGNASTASAAKSGSALETAINAKANAASVTGATKCKVTYNSQGVVTAGADLAASDIPNLAASKITSGTFADERIASASKWNAKQNALTQGTNITISGSTISATDTTYAEVSEADVKKIVTDLS